MSDCIFCKIVAGEIPAERLYEDDETLAFIDIHPNNPGHTLVIPKFHAPNIYEMSDEAIESTFKTVRAVARAVKDGVRADGINLIINNDAAAGQVVFHAHVHVIPRRKGDGLKHWPQKKYEEGEAANIAEKIRKAL